MRGRLVLRKFLLFFELIHSWYWSGDATFYFSCPKNDMGFARGIFVMHHHGVLSDCLKNPLAASFAYWCLLPPAVMLLGPSALSRVWFHHIHVCFYHISGVILTAWEGNLRVGLSSVSFLRPSHCENAGASESLCSSVGRGNNDVFLLSPSNFL